MTSGNNNHLLFGKNLAIHFTENDDRIILISEFIKKAIINYTSNSLNKIEIEFRIGSFYPNNLGKNSDKTNPEKSPLLSIPHCIVLPEEDKQSVKLFNFKPGLNSNFFWFLVNFLKNNKLKIDETFTEDLFDEDKSRTTYDLTTKIPIHTIIKENRSNLSILNLGKDVRITIVNERKIEQKLNQKIVERRKKHRFSILYEFFRFDFTHVIEMNQRNSKSVESWEFEIEIEDINFLRQYISEKNQIGNFIIFNKLICRIMNNIYSIYDIFEYQFIPSFKQIQDESYKKNFPSNNPEVGEYIASITYQKELMKLNEEINKYS